MYSLIPVVAIIFGCLLVAVIVLSSVYLSSVYLKAHSTNDDDLADLAKEFGERLGSLERRFEERIANLETIVLEQDKELSLIHI